MPILKSISSPIADVEKVEEKPAEPPTEPTIINLDEKGKHAVSWLLCQDGSWFRDILPEERFDKLPLSLLLLPLQKRRRRMKRRI